MEPANFNLLLRNILAMNKLLSIFFFVLFSLSNAFAQLDPTFGTNGVTVTDIPAVFNGLVNSFVLPNGKILVVHQGIQTLNPATRSYNFIRYNANGTLDTSYGTNGIQALALPFIRPDSILAAIRQNDGKILLAGTDLYDAYVIRLNENGSFDTSFAGTGMDRRNFFNFETDLSNFILQPDGKIILSGSTVSSTGLKNFIFRYLPNGTPDTAFGNQNNGAVFYDNSGADSSYIGIYAQQSSGKLIGYSRAAIYRFESNGNVDSSFQSVPLDQFDFRTFNSLSITVDSSDKILLLGTVVKSNDSLLRNDSDMLCVRFNPNGTIDTGFGVNGSVKIDITSSQNDESALITVQSDGKIVISGHTEIALNRSNLFLYSYNISLTKLNTDGSVNGKFLLTDGYNKQGIFGGSGLSILPNGNIITVSTTPRNNSYTNIVLTKSIGIPLTINRLHGVPYIFSGDGTPGISVFRPGTNYWYISTNGFGAFFGLNTDILAPSDYIGDFGTEYAVFRPVNGTWYIGKPQTVPSLNFLDIRWGTAGDIPAPADFDGDSKSDLTVFRPSNGVWYIRNSNDSSPRFVQWGTNGDKPVTGDYDGDGISDIAVWRPSNGVWYIIQSRNNQPRYVAFGLQGDIPIQEDYDGDGKTDIGVWRPSTGIWYIIKSSDSNYLISQFGIANDIPVSADFDGDQKTDIAVRRPGNNTFYAIKSSTNSFLVVPYGTTGDIPIAGRY
jgi:uncharacterized delta-60 repeat protein